MERNAELPSLLAARGSSPSKIRTDFEAKHDGGNCSELFEKFDGCKKEFGSIFDETIFADLATSWEHCKNLDDILAIGETQIVKPTLAQLNDIAPVNEPKALISAKESPKGTDKGKQQPRRLGNSPPTWLIPPPRVQKVRQEDGKQIILIALDELINAYREDAFQAQLRILLESENQLRKRQARAPAPHVEGREELCSQVLRDVLPKYGFVGIQDGQCDFALAARPYYNDADVQEKLKTIDVLLGLPLNGTFVDLRILVRFRQPHLKVDTIFKA